MPSSSPLPNGEPEQHRPAITRYIRRMVRDRSEAEDLTQETFIRAFRQRATLRDESVLLGWLYQIADLFGLPLTTVKMRLHRARRRLQAMLQEACALGKDERGVLVCDPKVQ